MELTKEYFDKGILNILEKIADTELSIRADMATKDDLVGMASKDDLKAQTLELKEYVHQAFELHQDWTEERLKEFAITYDVRDRVKKLEKDVAQLKQRA